MGTREPKEAEAGESVDDTGGELELPARATPALIERRLERLADDSSRKAVCWLDGVADGVPFSGGLKTGRETVTWGPGEPL